VPPLSSVYTMTDPKQSLKGPPQEKLGITDVLAFVLAAFIHVLPITLIGIGVFIVLWIVLTLVL
jgi:hypothetical protein